MCLRVCAGILARDTFDGCDRLEAKLQRCHFDAACVIPDVFVDDVIATMLSQLLRGVKTPGISSSHHRSRHAAIDGIEKATRARYGVLGSRGSC